ncbi:hypothetical protein EDB89DRAFT_2234187 [Lactarius sanguifluus]|nr:hypothetical protein EDB89DRAFT_2234187 [Lactarius sanguifluus]
MASPLWVFTSQHTYPSNLSHRHTIWFAVVGTSNVGSFIVDALFKYYRDAPVHPVTLSEPHSPANKAPHITETSKTRNKQESLKNSQFGLKGTLHAKLYEVGPPLLLVYTGTFADILWTKIVGLDVTTGKSPVGRDGNSPVSFTMHGDVARPLAYVLSFTPLWRSRITRPCSFNGIFNGFEERTGKKLDDFDAYLHLNSATDGLKQ